MGLNAAGKNFLCIAILFAFVSIILSSSAFAVSTRSYCKYAGGSGSYACDSGAVSGNSAACAAANGAQCAQEGDVFCYAESTCEAGTTLKGPIYTYNVNWDADSADCSCKAGSSRWGIRFISGTTGQCCGDDASEYFIGATNQKNIDKIDTCCKSDAYVFNGVCCGDDASEYYAGSTNGKSCDGTQACCSSPSLYSLNSNCVSSCPAVTSVYWTDLSGTRINSTELNDYVMLVAETSGAEGMLINFTLWEEGIVKCYEEVSRAYSNQGKASILWKVKACADGSNDGNKFKAFVSSTPLIYLESGLLAVSLVESDKLPVAVISQPADGGIFNLGDNINFVSGSYDPDDLITSVKWDFGDGYTSMLANTTHAYSAGGPKFAILTVQNSRGKTAEVRIGILINSSSDDPPLAMISSPSYGEKFSGMLITFNATMSRDDRTPFNQLIFKWEFDDGSSPYSGTGISGAYFTKLFSTAGEHLVKLSVDDSGPGSLTETSFSINGCQVPLDGTSEFVPFGSCSSISKHYFCANETTYYDTMEEHCEGADKQALTSDDCCPRGFYCPAIGAACSERSSNCASYNISAECEQYGCIWLNSSCAEPAGMSSCSDYKSEAACNTDVLGLGRSVGRGLGTDICGRTFGSYLVNASSCKCGWEPAGSPSGNCKFGYSVVRIIPGNVTFITCMKSFTLSDCVAGTQSMNWTALILPSELAGNETARQQCSEGYKGIKCGVSISRLPFFGIFNFVLAVAAIALYYLSAATRRNIKK
ncbi:MAG: PKD domain-containing protein [archaeon]